MAFINIKTEFLKGDYGKREVPTTRPIDEVFTSGLLDTVDNKTITFLTPKTILNMYLEDLNNTTIEDIQKPFTVEVGNPGDTTYNTPLGLTGLDTIAKNIETEYVEGRTSTEIPKFTIPETGPLGDFVDKTTKDIL